MIDLYICYTYYHLLIAMIKALINKKAKTDVILSSDNDNGILVKNHKMIEKLEKSNIFNNIIIYDKTNEELLLKKSKTPLLKKICYIKKSIKECPINFEIYKNIYFFNDSRLLGKCINSKKIHYHLIEDGTDCYINNKNLIKEKINIKHFIKKYIFKFYAMGESKRIIDIEVNNKNGVFIKNKKIIECPKKYLLSSISSRDAQIIQEIFMNNLNLEKYNGYSLIITQPLSEDGILKSEEQKIKIYKDIILKYCSNDKVVLKTHPREKTNYSHYFNCDIITEIFPLEIMNFENLKFNKIITVSSSSINLITNADEKIFLGWQFLENYKKEVKNEKK